MNQRIQKILCVDDEPLNLSLLEAMLSPRGYDLVLAANGPEALEKIKEERIDICLLDVMMQGMDGFEVCRRIKADERHRSIPVVMITSCGDRENRIRGIEAGAEDFISKPFDNAEVLARIKMLLQVKSLNEELQKAHDKLETANMELEAFNYTVSHDLRSPLTAISGYSQILLSMGSDRLDKQSQGFIRGIYNGTLRMNGLIDTLLDFSSINRVELRHETVDMNGLAREIALELELSAPERRVTFRIAAGVTAEGDPGLLRVVLNNLLRNAWKYSGAREETVIEFGVTEVDGSPACFVRDNGQGFDMSFADRLFIPFQRLPGIEVEGNGIGLATVERIIRRHGGKLWADGIPDKGATFFFSLPGI